MAAEQKENLNTQLTINAVTALAWSAEGKERESKRPIAEALRWIEKTIQRAADKGHSAVFVDTETCPVNIRHPEVIKQLKQHGFKFTTIHPKAAFEYTQISISWNANTDS